MGLKLVEEFLAKSGCDACNSFRETAEMIAKVNVLWIFLLIQHQQAFKMFLGVTCEVSNYVEKDNCFSLILNDNPLIDYVELPKHLQGLSYSNIICGVIRGALESVKTLNEFLFYIF